MRNPINNGRFHSITSESPVSHWSSVFILFINMSGAGVATLKREEISRKDKMLSKCDVGGDSWESLGLQGDPTSPSKGNQSWIFTGRTYAQAKAPILRPPVVKSWLIGKDPDARKDWRQEEKVATQDEIVEWHHWLSEHELKQTLEF